MFNDKGRTIKTLCVYLWGLLACMPCFSTELIEFPPETRLSEVIFGSMPTYGFEGHKGIEETEGKKELVKLYGKLRMSNLQLDLDSEAVVPELVARFVNHATIKNNPNITAKQWRELILRSLIEVDSIVGVEAFFYQFPIADVQNFRFADGNSLTSFAALSLSPRVLNHFINYTGRVEGSPVKIEWINDDPRVSGVIYEKIEALELAGVEVQELENGNVKFIYSNLKDVAFGEIHAWVNLASKIIETEKLHTIETLRDPDYKIGPIMNLLQAVKTIDVLVSNGVSLTDEENEIYQLTKQNMQDYLLHDQSNDKVYSLLTQNSEGSKDQQCSIKELELVVQRSIASLYHINSQDWLIQPMRQIQYSVGQENCFSPNIYFRLEAENYQVRVHEFSGVINDNVATKGFSISLNEFLRVSGLDSMLDSWNSELKAIKNAN